MVTPAEELLLPHPSAPSAAARVSIVETFHQLIPFLPRFLDIRPRTTIPKVQRSHALSIFESHILCSGPLNPQSKRPAHCEAEGAHRIEEIGPLRVVGQVENVWGDLAVPYIRKGHLSLVNIPRALVRTSSRGRYTSARQIGETRGRAGELRCGGRNDLGHP